MLWQVLQPLLNDSLAQYVYRYSLKFQSSILVSGSIQHDHPIANYSCNYIPREDSIDVYWINLDRSVSRRKQMEVFLSKLGLSNERVRALSIKDMFIPSDIMRKVDNREPLCVLQTENDPSLPDKSSTSSTDPNSVSPQEVQKEIFEKIVSTQKGARKVFIKGVCGTHTNTVKELITVSSHLLAIYQACFSPTANGKFALIVEDDVWTPFDIDFEELIETVPTLNFGILQLFNSKPIALADLFRHYKKSKMLWYDRPVAFDARFLATFSTGAYIINREVMRPIISQLLGLQGDWLHLTIMAGNTIPSCRPAICCDGIDVNQFVKDYHSGNADPKLLTAQNTKLPFNYFVDNSVHSLSNFSTASSSGAPSSLNFNESIPYCMYAPVGYQADSFLYTLAKTWTLTFPLFLDGPGSDESTIHQHHVIKMHRTAFYRIREYQQQLLTDEVILPHFVKKACPVESVMGKNLAANNV